MTGQRALVALSVAALACSPSPRDLVPVTRDVHVVPDGGAAGGTEAYEHVARRAHGVLALAEARNMKQDEARALVERWADEMERCMTGLDAQGILVEGAARVIAVGDANGTPALNVKLAPGDAVAQNALLCIVAPVRASTLPVSSSRASPAATPGLAIEATWSPIQRGRARDGSADAGAVGP